MSESDNKFKYTYSAKDQAEIKKIREKYTLDAPRAELSNIEKIKRLDSNVTKKAMVTAFCIGVIGSLIMGFGMSLIMTDLKEILGSNRDLSLIIGTAIGIIGMIAVIIAYPIYQMVIEKERKKTAPEILRLSEDILSKN